jgi:hypothetical protein
VIPAVSTSSDSRRIDRLTQRCQSVENRLFREPGRTALAAHAGKSDDTGGSDDACRMDDARWMYDEGPTAE